VSFPAPVEIVSVTAAVGVTVIASAALPDVKVVAFALPDVIVSTPVIALPSIVSDIAFAVLNVIA
jgi:hypothetical protein